MSTQNPLHVPGTTHVNFQNPYQANPLRNRQEPARSIPPDYRAEYQQAAPSMPAQNGAQTSAQDSAQPPAHMLRKQAQDDTSGMQDIEQDEHLKHAQQPHHLPAGNNVQANGQAGGQVSGQIESHAAAIFAGRSEGDIKQLQKLEIDLKRHNIEMVIPAGAVFSGRLTLKGGLVIHGKVENAQIRCETGSLIIMEGGSFSGVARAPRVMITGEVHDMGNTNSQITGDLLIAISQHAKGRGDLYASVYSIHTKNFGGHFSTIPLKEATMKESNPKNTEGPQEGSKD